MSDYLEELVQKITTKADLKGFDDLERKQKRAIKSNDLLAKSFRRAFGIFFGMQGVRSVIKTTREIDLLQRSIQGLTGTADDWQYLRREAYRTGTDLTKAAQAYKNFYSAANKSGFQKPHIQSMFSDVLVAGRGIGANQQQIGAALLALEQMLSKGKVSMEELRRQMGNALPGSFEIAAKSMGVTTQEFNKMLEAGLDANEFVPKFTAMLRKELGKGFEANIKSLDFALVNLSNAWREFQTNILQGDAGEALAQLVRDITKILRSQELLKFIQLIGKGLAFIFKHLKLIMVLFGYKKILDLIVGLKSINNVIVSLEKGTKGLVSATNLLYLKWGLILGILLLIQDIIMGIMNPNADTYYNDIMRNHPGDDDVIEDSKDSIGGPVYKDPEAGLTVAEKQKRHKNAMKSKRVQKATISMPRKEFKPFIRDEGATGSAAPIPKLIDTDIPIPKLGYTGTLPNIKDDFKDKKSNSTINLGGITVNAVSSQPEAIAQSVEDVLQKFFAKYELGYA